MKRLLIALFAIAITTPLFAVQHNIVDDVIRMHRAGVSDDEIIQFLHKTDSRFNVSADDMVALADAKVSRDVIKAVLDEADSRGERRDDRGYSRGRDTVIVAGGYPYVYAPYGYYDPWFYDPWYYGPRFSFGFGFGFGGYYGGYHGGHFRHRHR